MEGDWCDTTWLHKILASGCMVDFCSNILMALHQGEPIYWTYPQPVEDTRELPYFSDWNRPCRWTKVVLSKITHYFQKNAVFQFSWFLLHKRKDCCFWEVNDLHKLLRCSLAFYVIHILLYVMLPSGDVYCILLSLPRFLLGICMNLPYLETNNYHCSGGAHFAGECRFCLGQASSF